MLIKISESNVPKIALVGRTNVGKSTFFNYLTRSRKSIVSDQAGSTRDRLYAQATYNNKAYQIIDSAGLALQDDDIFGPSIRKQLANVIAEADVILFMIDAKVGILAKDIEIAKFLRKSSKNIITVCNKVDNESFDYCLPEATKFGFKGPFAISAAQGLGIADLFETIDDFCYGGEEDCDPGVDIDCHPGWCPDLGSRLRGNDIEEYGNEVQNQLDTKDKAITIALLGRPNVGKSSLLNSLAGFERSVVSDVAGTTTDAVDLHLDIDGKLVTIIDTAGIRRKRSIYNDLEKVSINKTLGSLDQAQVSIFMLDAVEGITEQDLKVAGFADDKGKGLVIVVNKWDQSQAQGLTKKAFIENIKYRMPFLAYAPLLFISAKNKTGIKEIFTQVYKVAAEYEKRISTAQLNDWLADTILKHEPKVVKGRRIKFYFITQVSSAPPIFLFNCNYPDEIHFSYKRYLSNQLREAFGFIGSPIKMVFKGKNKKQNDNDE